MRRIAIIGYGKIAADEHAPAIAGGGEFQLVAASKREPIDVDGIVNYTDYAKMLREAACQAIAICTPPSVRYAMARDCLDAGKHVMLEKPPGVTLGEVEALEAMAAARNVTLMTTWHAQANDAVVRATAVLAERRIGEVRITWHEDVRKWHPGQQWIWEPGGFGVFDPGINALSIATEIVPGALIVRAAELFLPANRAMPIAARLKLESPAVDGTIAVDLDWRKTEGETWTIEVDLADGGSLTLLDGGARLMLDGAAVEMGPAGEYPLLYRQFAELIAKGESRIDLEPLRVVADAFLVGTRTEVEAFED